MGGQNLPYEICQLIFQHVNSNTLYQCIFVCKSWNLAAVHAYYRDFFLTGETIKYFQCRLPLYERKEIDDIPQLTTKGSLVRTFTIHQDRERKLQLTGKEFSTVLSFMPNIKKVDLKNTMKRRYYLKKLQNTKIHAVDLKHLEEIAMVSKSFSIRYGGMKEYFKACYKHRQSIKYLYLTHLGTQIKINGQVGGYYSFLSDFKSLTTLYIDNNNNNRTLLCPVFKACPNLIKLTYNCSNPIRNDTTVEYSTLKSQGGNSESSNTIVLTRQQQQNHFYHYYCKNLKKMILSASYIDLKCLIFYIPPQLKTLDIRMGEKSFDKWFQNNDSLTIMEFAKHLRSVDRLSISMGKHIYHYGRHIGWFGRPSSPRRPETDITLEKRLSNYWTFIDAFTKGQNLKVHFTLNLFEDMRGEPTNRFKFDVSKHDNRVDLQYALNIKDCINEEAGTIDLPHFLQIVNDDNTGASKKKELPAVHSIHINMKDRIYNYTTADKKFNAISAIEYIVLNCHHLTNVSVSTTMERYQFKSKSNTSRQLVTGSPSAIDNMTRCYLKRVEFSSEISDLLNDTFHNIKMLDLEYCDFSADEYCNYHWDFTGINYMENLKLDMSKLNTSRARSYIFFQIEMNEESIKYYQLNKKSARGERLVSTTYKNVIKFNRVNSLKTTVFFIKFAKVDSITLLIKHGDTETMSFN